ncbi:PLP-dependent aminotransferase family protein [Celeribacter sp.]|uniref:MocR-like ectoine utilization transcription factor EhuR n=1 Tax=Celeribacter sp. TaxID=1890673 RepID=UPI003A8FC73B
MSHWPLTPDDITRPAYRSLAQGISAAIASGALSAGTQLPTHRELAWKLNLSVQTVSRAYEELIREDLITGEVGRGTFVKARQGGPADVPWHRDTDGHRKAPIDMSNMSPVRLPEIEQAWRNSLVRVAEKLPPEAMYALRPAQVAARYGGMASNWVARCGMVVPADRILLTNGVTPAMFVALSAAATPGDVIATQSATGHPLKPVARHLMLRLQGIEEDDQGMIPEALVEAAKAAKGTMKAVYLLPTASGPHAYIMPRDRRAALAKAAEEAGIVIIESDPFGPLAPRRPPPVTSFAPDRSFYLTGMSKCLSPGLRLGFLVMPKSHAQRTRDRHLTVSWTATPMMAEIATDWIDSGTADTVIAAQRAELAARNRMAMRELGAAALGTLHGLHRWLPLPDGMREEAMLDLALKNNVAVAAGSTFSVSDPVPAVRICLGGPSRADVAQGLRTIASFLPTPSPSDVPKSELSRSKLS